MTEAVPIGQVVELDGRRLRRVPSGGQVRPEFTPYVTRSIPRNTSGFRHDSKGRCIVENRQQEERWRQAAGLEWE